MSPTEALGSSAAALSLATVGVFLVAGVVKGVVGLGLPTVSMALLALTMAPADAAVLLIVPSLVTNLWQARPWATLGSALARLGPLQIGVCLGTFAGAALFGAPAGSAARIALGAALIAYAAWGLFGTRFSVGSKTEAWLGPLVGACTGLLSAATGVFVIPAVPYLQALGLQREELIQAMGISFSVSTLALALALHFTASYSAATLASSAWLLLPALAGMQVGQVLRRRLSAERFRKCFLASLFGLGLYMVAQEIWAQEIWAR
jgi:uncharacterized membrane protein YfcA